MKHYPSQHETRMRECIYDISQLLPMLRQEPWWPEETDSREIFKQVCECAEFYEEHYPDTDEYMEDIEELARAWFADEFCQPLTTLELLALCTNRHVATYIREHVGEMTMTDYDWWATAEEALGHEITVDEYHKLNDRLAGEYSLMDLSVDEIKALYEKILPKKMFRITRTWTMTPTMTVEIEAKSEEEAERLFESAYEDGEYWEEADDACAFAEVCDEEVYIEEVSK